MAAGDMLLERVVELYYETQLPVEPGERLAALRDIVARQWAQLDDGERAAVVEELRHDTDVLPVVGQPAGVSAGELANFGEAAVDGLTQLARMRIPELAVPEV